MKPTELPEQIQGLPGYAVTATGEGADCAPAAKAKHRWGIQYQGSYESEHDGTARAVRLHARALQAAGMPVLLESYTGKFVGRDGVVVDTSAMEDSVALETESLRRADVGALVVRVKHMVVSTFDMLQSFIVPQFVLREQNSSTFLEMFDYVLRTTVVYSVWERSTIDPRVAELLSRLAECWVPSEQNKKLLEDHGVKRVVVVPHPWMPASNMAKLTRRVARVPGVAPIKRFYSIGSWQPRKGFHELLGAFLLAFRPGAPAHLTIKYRNMRWPDYPSPEESVKRWFSHPDVVSRGWTQQNAAPHLKLYGDHWSDDQVLKLHFDSNIYVSASHGEAWCLPAYDAKVAGNALVHVPYGGTADFASEGDVAVPYTMAPVPKSYRWEADAKWAVYRIEDLADALRRAEAPTEFRRPDRFEERFGFESVGKLMRERIVAIMRREMPTLEGI